MQLTNDHQLNPIEVQIKGFMLDIIYGPQDRIPSNKEELLDHISWDDLSPDEDDRSDYGFNHADLVQFIDNYVTF